MRNIENLYSEAHCFAFKLVQCPENTSSCQVLSYQYIRLLKYIRWGERKEKKHHRKKTNNNVFFAYFRFLERRDQVASPRKHRSGAYMHSDPSSQRCAARGRHWAVPITIRARLKLLVEKPVGTPQRDVHSCTASCSPDQSSTFRNPTQLIHHQTTSNNCIHIKHLCRYFARLQRQKTTFPAT